MKIEFGPQHIGCMLVLCDDALHNFLVVLPKADQRQTAQLVEAMELVKEVKAILKGVTDVEQDI